MSTCLPVASRKRPWKKVLYEQQPYPDNHVADSFLTGLQKNANVTFYSPISIICASGIFAQELCLIFIQQAFFNWIKFNYDPVLSNQSKTDFISGLAITFIFALFIGELLLFGEQWEQMSKNVMKFFLFTCIISYFARIWLNGNERVLDCLAIAIQLIRLLFQDYGLQFSWVSCRLSNRLLLLSCVIRCSILSSGVRTVWFALFNSVLFVLTGSLLCQTRHSFNTTFKHLISLITVIITYFILFSFNQTNTFLAVFTFTLLFFNLFCPILYHKLQSHKDVIGGPWDEAQLDEAFYE